MVEGRIRKCTGIGSYLYFAFCLCYFKLLDTFFMLMMEKISLVKGPLINTFPAKVCIKNSCLHCGGGGIVRWCSCQAQTLQNFASSQSPLKTDEATILSHCI